MPEGKFHDKVANEIFGVIPSDLNREIDVAVDKLGPAHRIIGHDEEDLEKIIEKYTEKYGVPKKPIAYYVAKLHIACDYCPLTFETEKVPKSQKPLVDYLLERVTELKTENQEKSFKIEEQQGRILSLSTALKAAVIFIKLDREEKEGTWAGDLLREGKSPAEIKKLRQEMNEIFEE